MNMTRRTAIAGTAMIAAAASALAAPATYAIDSAHSSAQFRVKHLMIANVRGEFSKVTGSLTFDASNLAACAVEASIPIDTVNTREEARDKHLKSPDFFDAAKFPAITFKSTKFEAGSGKGNYKVTGDLTMHGVTKPVVLTVESSAEVKGMRGETRMGAQATTRINRKDFGVSWSRNLDGGGVAVSDEVDITIDMELIKK